MTRRSAGRIEQINRHKQSHPASASQGKSTLTDPSNAKSLLEKQTLEISASDFNLERLVYRVVNTNNENPDARFIVSQSTTNKTVTDAKFINFSKDGSGFKIMFKPQQGEMVSFKTSDGTIKVTFSKIHEEVQLQAPIEEPQASFGRTVVAQQTAPETEKPKSQTERKKLCRFERLPESIKGKRIRVYNPGATKSIREGVVNFFDMGTDSNWYIFFKGDRTYTQALAIDTTYEYEVVEEQTTDPRTALLGELERTIGELKQVRAGKSAEQKPTTPTVDQTELEVIRVKLQLGQEIGFGSGCRKDYNHAVLELLRECAKDGITLKITMKDSPRDFSGNTFTGKVKDVDPNNKWVQFHNPSKESHPTMNLLSEQVTIIQTA